MSQASRGRAAGEHLKSQVKQLTIGRLVDNALRGFDGQITHNATFHKGCYEMSSPCYFSNPQPLRTLAEIPADILARCRRTGGLPSEIIGEAAG